MTLSTASKIRLFLTTLVLCQSTAAYANISPWYVSADLGIFQGNYDLIYNDTTDLIAANFRQTLQQYGYNGGLALGYSKTCDKKYLLGAEVSGYLTTSNANFASGDASSSIRDQIKIQNYFDFVLVPGLYITDSVAAYFKVGLSWANVKDTLIAPTSSIPTYVTTNSNSYLWGAALGIGMRKFITPKIVVFTEYQYHDYGTDNFPSFVNFTASYNHSAHVYSQSIMLGLSYFFDDMFHKD